MKKKFLVFALMMAVCFSAFAPMAFGQRSASLEEAVRVTVNGIKRATDNNEPKTVVLIYTKHPALTDYAIDNISAGLAESNYSLISREKHGITLTKEIGTDEAKQTANKLGAELVVFGGIGQFKDGRWFWYIRYIKAASPADEKVGYTDLFINYSGTMAELVPPAPPKRSLFAPVKSFFSAADMVINPAVSFSWYPSANYSGEYTNTTDDGRNYGISAMLGLKLFEKYGAQFNLKIDDPTFQKMVDFAGLLNINNVVLKFDYHAFGGNITWKDEDKPNLIPENSLGLREFGFRETWTTFHLMYHMEFIPIFYWTFGISMVNLQVPVEYLVNEKTEKSLSNPGFGMIKGRFWGVSFLIDTLAKKVDELAEWGGADYYRDSTFNIWILSDFVLAFSTSFEFDKTAVARMAAANSVDSIDAKVEGINGGYMKGSLVLGLQKAWDIDGEIFMGIGIGADMMFEFIGASTTDITVSYSTINVGPSIRFSVRF